MNSATSSLTQLKRGHYINGDGREVAELSTHSPQQDPGQAARVAAGQGDELSGARRPCPGTRFCVATTTENKGPS